ncbi:MAG TPA: GxGYxYP domain-containing protein [Acidimicrobiales bacterium]|nr:GxGYxYP domain-containing protein [Acidimicrobiales bacterium]
MALPSGHHSAQAETAERSGASGTIPESIIDRYLTTQPPLGDVTVVTVTGESTPRKLLAATLQGMVNRTSARIYLVGARNVTQDQHWIDDYVARGLIHVVAHATLDEALATFAGELDGYVVADYSEPWTINTATTVAAAHRGVVATWSQVAQLQALGLTEIADHRGRWTDATTAYVETAAAERSNLAYQGLAIQQTDANNPRDFFVQQGIMTVFTRPSHADYDQVMDLLDPYPVDHPVYGYVSDDGTEEVLAIIRLSQSGRFLVPTDTTDNLSFHIAVAADRSRTVLRPMDGPVASCDATQVNVVVATSDGDNMVIPEAYLPSDAQWGSANRGTLPIGWGITPATAVLMPAVWDWYAQHATGADEVVGLVGLGYSAPSLMPDPSAFLTDSNVLAEQLGVDTVWSLDLLLSDPTAPGWDAIAAANVATGWHPEGMLLNYQRFGSVTSFTAAGMPVFAAQSTDYDVGAPAIAAHIDTLLATPAEERSLVNFFPATVWNATYDQLLAALAPYADQGVRFLTPREAFACISAADPGATSTSPPSTDAPTSTTSTTVASVPPTTSLETDPSSPPTSSGSVTRPPSTSAPSTAAPTTVGSSPSTPPTSAVATPSSALPGTTAVPSRPGNPSETGARPADPVVAKPAFTG